MGSSQLYSLTWGEFGTSLVSAVQLLRCHGDLVDVTLAAGGRSFPAHKIVLCAASPFLLNLLKSTPCQHPVVMLAGVTAPDLEALLEFVYRGEVSVDSNQLPSLLQAAHCLNIQGLAPGTISAEPEEITSVSSAHEALTRDVINSFLPIRRRKRTKRRNSSGPQSKWARQDDVDSENRPLDQQEAGAGSLSSEQDVLNIPDVPRKSEELDSNTPPEDSGAEAASDGDSGSGAAGASSARKSHGTGGGSGSSVSDQPATCPLCNATLRQARNLRRHLELLHFGVGRSTVRVRSRRSSAPGPAPGPGPGTAPAPGAGPATAVATGVSAHGQVHGPAHTVSGPQAGNAPSSAAADALAAAQRATYSSLALSSQPASVVTTVLAPAQGSRTSSPPPSQQQLAQSVQLAQMVPLAPGLLDATQSHLLAPPPLPPHCQAQQILTPSLRRLDECAPQPASALQSPLLSPSSHEALFRQHHAELLRGAGLYTDPRALTAPGASAVAVSPAQASLQQSLQQHPPPAHNHAQGPAPSQHPDMRQEVA